MTFGDGAVGITAPLDAAKQRQSGVPVVTYWSLDATRGRTVWAQPLANVGSAGRTRTCDPVVNSHLLYQLSYRGSGSAARVISVDARYRQAIHRASVDPGAGRHATTAAHRICYNSGPWPRVPSRGNARMRGAIHAATFNQRGGQCVDGCRLCGGYRRRAGDVLQHDRLTVTAAPAFGTGRSAARYAFNTPQRADRCAACRTLATNTHVTVLRSMARRSGVAATVGALRKMRLSPIEYAFCGEKRIATRCISII